MVQQVSNNENNKNKRKLPRTAQPKLIRVNLKKPSEGKESTQVYNILS